MPRGWLASEYVDDDGTPWKLQVDADYATDTDRGWTTGLTPGLPPLPRLWSPREVVGIDPTGRVVTTRVATLDSPLWTGAAQTFTFRASDGAFYTATVVERRGERRRV